MENEKFIAAEQIKSDIAKFNEILSYEDPLLFIAQLHRSGLSLEVITPMVDTMRTTIEALKTAAETEFEEL